MHSDDVISQSFLYLAAEAVTTGTVTFSLSRLRLQPLLVLSARTYVTSLTTCISHIKHSNKQKF